MSKGCMMCESTLSKSRRVYTGQNTFPILVLKDVIGEHKGREKKMYKEGFLRKCPWCPEGQKYQ